MFSRSQKAFPHNMMKNFELEAKRRRSRERIILVALALMVVTFASPSRAGFLEGLADFGKNLLSTAAANYNTMYGNQLQQLLTALQQPGAEGFPQDMTGGNPTTPFNPYPSDTGFPQDQAVMQEYPGAQDHPDGYEFDAGYSSQGDPGYADSPDQEFGYQDTTGFAQDPYQDARDGDQQERHLPDSHYGDYQNQEISDASQPAHDFASQHNIQQQGTPDMPQPPSAYVPPENDMAIGQDPTQPRIPHAPVKLDVALVRKAVVNGAETVIPIQDGEVLRDGRGDAHAGDKFRIMFRANAECHVYVIAIDGSAWAQGIFPTMNSPFANPVEKDRQYVIPEGNNWLSLDQFRGIETIFFVASHEKREDIETILAGIAGQERHPKATPDQVSEPTIIPGGYDGQRTSTSPFTVTTNTGQGFLPTTFMTEKAGQALRVTRWFRHQ